MELSEGFPSAHSGIVEFAPRSVPTRLLGIGQKELVLQQEMKTTVCDRAAVNKVSFKGRAAQRAAVLSSLQVFSVFLRALRLVQASTN